MKILDDGAEALRSRCITRLQAIGVVVPVISYRGVLRLMERHFPDDIMTLEFRAKCDGNPHGAIKAWMN